MTITDKGYEPGRPATQKLLTAIEDEQAKPVDPYIAYVETLAERDRLKTELALANAALRDSEEQVLEAFTAGETDRITVRGVTLYPRRDLRVGWNLDHRPGESDRAALRAKLKALGLGHLLKEAVPLQTLTAYYREEAEEADETDEVLPEELRDLLKISDRFVVGHTGG